MDKENVPKISFITDQEIYVYKKMSFGLKNTKPTYQRLVDQIFGA